MEVCEYSNLLFILQFSVYMGPYAPGDGSRVLVRVRVLRAFAIYSLAALESKGRGASGAPCDRSSITEIVASTNKDAEEQITNQDA